MHRETTSVDDDKCKSYRRNDMGIQDKKPINGHRGVADLRDFFFFRLFMKKTVVVRILGQDHLRCTD